MNEHSFTAPFKPYSRDESRKNKMFVLAFKYAQDDLEHLSLNTKILDIHKMSNIIRVTYRESHVKIKTHKKASAHDKFRRARTFRECYSTNRRCSQ